MFKKLFEKLTGQQIPLSANESVLESLDLSKLGLGYSQFNELLLFLGYDRINNLFFQFLVNGTIEWKPESTIIEISELEKNIDKFIEISQKH